MISLLKHIKQSALHTKCSLEIMRQALPMRWHYLAQEWSQIQLLWWDWCQVCHAALAKVSLLHLVATFQHCRLNSGDSKREIKHNNLSILQIKKYLVAWQEQLRWFLLTEEEFEEELCFVDFLTWLFWKSLYTFLQWNGPYDVLEIQYVVIVHWNTSYRALFFSTVNFCHNNKKKKYNLKYMKKWNHSYVLNCNHSHFLSILDLFLFFFSRWNRN